MCLDERDTVLDEQAIVFVGTLAYGPGHGVPKRATHTERLRLHVQMVKRYLETHRLTKVCSWSLV